MTNTKYTVKFNDTKINLLDTPDGVTWVEMLSVIKDLGLDMREEWHKLLDDEGEFQATVIELDDDDVTLDVYLRLDRLDMYLKTINIAEEVSRFAAQLDLYKEKFFDAINTEVQEDAESS